MSRKKLMIGSREKRLVCMVFSFYVVRSDSFQSDNEMTVLLALLQAGTSVARCREELADSCHALNNAVACVMII